MTWEQQRVSFGANASTYDSMRPGWPADTARWLTGDAEGALDVLDLGAGTGKLTSTLVELGHRVTAVEPDEGMLAVLSAKLPGAEARAGSAERIPLPDGSVDVVTVAQAWHWMEQPAAALEVARVLRPGGLLAVAWHQRDVSVPWVGALNDVAGGPEWTETGGDPNAPRRQVHAGHTKIELPTQYAALEAATFTYTLHIPPAALADLASSWSYVATRPDRDEVLQRIRELGERVAAEQGTPDLLGLPHLTHAYRARTH
ncbi:class I SAM-dependent methyltransferase [Kineosporia succinea]|uniref:Ubiquinone/menaquinone biosynthesis C-methylase UbiE n=1 Tax=Kineosporia succinea TaxID=84632 RepID=A0ABT9P1W9_9ACTN|nr:class I SAM-dependent methyltransferase [Kineosporia succinea]MDP9826672.1 ubiquinone/menaquinone biosynthesis C-methylase UbiE [Kineosporia succinea]